MDEQQPRRTTRRTQTDWSPILNETGLLDVGKRQRGSMKGLLEYWADFADDVKATVDDYRDRQSLAAQREARTQEELRAARKRNRRVATILGLAALVVPFGATYLGNTISPRPAPVVVYYGPSPPPIFTPSPSVSSR